MDNNGQYYDTDIYMDNTYDLTLCKCLEDIGIFRCFMIQRQGLCIDHGPWFAVQRCTLFIFSRYYRQYLEAKLILTALFRLNRCPWRCQEETTRCKLPSTLLLRPALSTVNTFSLSFDTPKGFGPWNLLIKTLTILLRDRNHHCGALSMTRKLHQ